MVAFERRDKHLNYFHLAIPTHDVQDSVKYYTEVLNVQVGRTYSGYAIFNFYGHQLVLHRHDDISDKPQMYPRHFGIILESLDEFEQLYNRLTQLDVDFFQERFERYRNEAGWHETFFIADPSNNLIEFKYYHDSNDIF